MKNPSHKQQFQIDKYFQELQQLQAIESQHETTKLFQELEKKIALKLIECVDNISVDDKQATSKILKLSQAYALLKQFRG